MVLLWMNVALAVDIPSLSYVGPPTRGSDRPKPGAAATDVTEWTRYGAGQSLFVATANANLRSGPSTTHEVVDTLPMGAPVKVVQAVTDPVVISDRVDRWYEVELAGGQRGFLFGGTLTPLSFRADLDGEPGDEVFTVSWRWDFALLVRSGSADGRSEKVQTRTYGGGRKGGVAHAELLPAEVAGVPTVLVSVELGTQTPAKNTTWLYAYRVHDGEAVEREGAYFHNYEGGVIETLRFDGKGAVCAAFNTRPASDVCADLRTGAKLPNVPMAELDSWTRFPSPLPFEGN